METKASGPGRAFPSQATPPNPSQSCATVILATDRLRRDGDDETDWHQVVVWDKLAEAVAQYVEKGQRIYVAGRLAQNSWTGDDGQRRYRTEIHAQDVVFLDSSRNGNGGGNNGSYASADAGQPVDDDLPF